MTSPWNRRQVLRGMGAALSLPWLPSLARAEAQPPKRLLVFVTPNGHHPASWRPVGTGTSFQPSPILEPLAAHFPRLQVISGLSGRQDRTLVHEVPSGSLLTGRDLGTDLSTGIGHGSSMDQMAARAFAGSTRLASLELTAEAPALCDITTNLGNFTAACGFYRTVSWADGQTPLPREASPRRAFERLFLDQTQGLSAYARARYTARRQSVLDLVLDDLERTQAKVGTEDATRLDAFTEGVFELERRLEAPEAACGTADPRAFERPADLVQTVQRMSELMVLALQCDATRVLSFMLGNIRSDRPLPHLGLYESVHVLSHHTNRPDRIADYVRVSRWYMEVLADLLDRLAHTEDTLGGDLLQHTAVLALSPIADGDQHTTSDLPVVLAGGDGEWLRPGRHLQTQDHTLADLHLTLLRRLGVQVDQVGELGTRPLDDL